MRLAGIEVGSDDEEWFVGRLYEDAHAPALNVVLRIQKALELGPNPGPLTPRANDDPGCLDGPPSSLSALRGVLMQES